MNGAWHTELQYAVIRQDTNGVKYLVGNDFAMTDEQASARIDEINGSHTKPHKMEYFKISYKPGWLASTLRDENIHF